MPLKSRLRAALVLLLIIPEVIAGAAPSGSGHPFALEPATDGALLGGALAVNLAAILLEPEAEPFGGTAPELGGVNAFDRWAARPWSAAIGGVSDATQALAILAPAVLAAAPQEQWCTVGLMYLEAAALSFGLKDLGKALVKRNRPYMYFGGYPQEGVDSGDYQDSFPSGHTTMAFTGAAFASYVFSRYYPESPFKVPVIAGSFALATTTGILRILSGNHFPTDVLAGAFIGCASGFLVPWLHTLDAGGRGRGMRVTLLPGGVSLGLAW